jgi:hypothetical protein
MSAEPREPYPATRGSRLWLWVVAAFVVQGLVWATWINLARKNPVQEVPLVHRR